MTASRLLRLLWQAAGVQLRLLSKSWSARLVDLIMPAAVAFVPAILGSTMGGEEASLLFIHSAQTSNVVGFLLIGGGTFLLITRAFWGFGGWLRQEMRNGTLETLYLAPAPIAVVLAGVALAFILYSALIFIGAMLIGALLFQIVFQTNQLALAFIFLLAGLPSIYGLALFYGVLVLRFKETDAFIQIAQWLITLLMGVYFPIALFPPLLKLISLLFPPTWLTQGLRSALLGVPYLSYDWRWDLGALLFFALITPLLGYLAFARMERVLKAASGLGEF